MATIDHPLTLPFDGLTTLIQQTWGYSTLRPLQQQAMQAMLDRRDSLVVLPTGGGKSLCYQAPAIYLSQHGNGPTVVISPLISLMKDQVDSLRSLGVAAAQLDSSLSQDDRRQVASDLRAGRLHLLFCSPERLIGKPMPGADMLGGGDGGGPEPALPANNWFQDLLRSAGVKTFAIDEAHCISHWGHDFRPEYRQLATLKTLFPGAVLHAFTATATAQVRKDIAAQLALQDPELLVGNFDRPNLTYRILPRVNLYKQIEEVLARHVNEAGIIYCLRRKDVDEITATLNETKSLGRKALGYHAGMTPDQRKRAQELFLNEEADLIVATIAFGMGIDRSNIRFVLHTGMPKSIEAYQQETGRAGRDGLEAECVLLHSGSDLFTWKSIIEKSAAEAQSAGVPIAADFVRNALGHLDDIDLFARSATCRHQSLVEYFGQQYELPSVIQDPELRTQDSARGCAACDHCLRDTTSVADAPVIAQKILSAVARTNQRFGAKHIIAILRGSNTQRIRQLGHDHLPTFGLLADHAEPEVRDYIYQLIGQGALTQESIQLSDGRSVPILKFTEHSKDFMHARRPVRLVQVVRKSAAEARKTRGDQISWEGVDHELFEALRALRKQIAAQRNVPPYVILSDATLRELARLRPTTLQNFRLVYGIGENKLKDLGTRFTAFIADHCKAKSLSTNLSLAASPSPGIAIPGSPPRPASSRPNPEKNHAFRMFQQGASIEEVSQKTGRAKSTLADYLADFITQERPASIARWVPDNVYKQVQAMKAQINTDRLKPLFLALGEEIPYDQIRLVLAHLANRPPDQPN